MTRLFDDPDRFAQQAADGFAAAFGAWVRRVPGGVARATEDEEPTVAVVTGGGSGHYPAFAGLVGPGLAHGAAMGELFASPSATRVVAVAREAERGQGVLLCYGNYAGDVLNFREAERQLRDAGIACETVIVTDDVSSAPASRAQLRRGVAGGLVVYKIAGAAAAERMPLAEVARLASAANERTRTLGVAYSGCTLPGADAPLFDVPDGRLAIGLGIHGEPGIAETAAPTAEGMAELLVSRLLAELPQSLVSPRGARVVPILNGLGSVKYEELFVVYGHVARLLAEAGAEIVEPEVGEFITSFDMAGLSLTLFWPDAELERLWAAPASSPAFRKGTAALGRTVAAPRVAVAADEVHAADAEAQQAAARIVTALAAAAQTINANADELGRIDAVAGDGDHGIGMRAGVNAALSAARDAATAQAGPGTVLRRAGDAWAENAGGTSGALWGVLLHAAAEVVGDRAPAPEALAAAADAASTRVRAAGGAVPGDKTMVDVLVPVAEALVVARPASWPEAADALAEAAAVARRAADETARLVPRLGRARTHGEKGLGTPDAGAVSLALVIAAVAESVKTVETIGEGRA